MAVVTRVRLLGEELVLKGDDDTVYLERLAAELDVRLKRMAHDGGLQSLPTRNALLVALNLMDELTKLKAEHARMERSTSEAAASMMKRIEHTLNVEEPTA